MDILSNLTPVIVAVVVKIFTFWAVQTFKIAPAACCRAFRSFWAMDYKCFNCWRPFGFCSGYQNVSCMSHVPGTYHSGGQHNDNGSTAAAAAAAAAAAGHWYGGGGVLLLLFLSSVSCALLKKMGAVLGIAEVIRPHEKRKCAVSYRMGNYSKGGIPPGFSVILRVKGSTPTERTCPRLPQTA